MKKKKPIFMQIIICECREFKMLIMKPNEFRSAIMSLQQMES